MAPPRCMSSLLTLQLLLAFGASVVASGTAYIYSAKGSNSCVAGSAHITTEAHCKTAASALGGTWVHNTAMSTRPRGCWAASTGNAEGWTYFNSHSTGSGYGDLRPICACAAGKEAGATSCTDTKTPTNAPTKAPTEAPSQAPSNAPTQAPTQAPTKAPSQAPTEAPSQAPSNAPTQAPTQAPTKAPSQAPTEAPSQAPTNAPTQAPTQAPTKAPSQAPTKAPSQAPTQAPTKAPTTGPKTIFTQRIEFAIAAKDWTGKVKSLGEAAYAWSVNIWDLSTNAVKPGYTLTSSVSRRASVSVTLTTTLPIGAVARFRVAAASVTPSKMDANTNFIKNSDPTTYSGVQGATASGVVPIASLHATIQSPRAAPAPATPAWVWAVCGSLGALVLCLSAYLWLRVPDSGEVNSRGIVGSPEKIPVEISMQLPPHLLGFESLASPPAYPGAAPTPGGDKSTAIHAEEELPSKQGVRPALVSEIEELQARICQLQESSLNLPKEERRETKGVIQRLEGDLQRRLEELAMAQGAGQAGRSTAKLTFISADAPTCGVRAHTDGMDNLPFEEGTAPEESGSGVPAEEFEFECDSGRSSDSD